MVERTSAPRRAPGLSATRPRPALRPRAGWRPRCSRPPSQRFWTILRYVARDSLITPATARGSERGEDDPGGLDRDVGAGADGDADVGPGQGRGVVDAVADHGHRQPAAWSSATLPSLSCGQHLGEDLVDAGIRGGDRSATGRVSPVIITTSTPRAVQLGDRLARLRPDLVLERERADHLGPSAHDGAAPTRRRPTSRRRLGSARRARRGELAQQGRAADRTSWRRRRSPATPRPVSDRKSGDAARRGRGPRGGRRWRGPAGARCRSRPRPASAQHLVLGRARPSRRRR